MRAVVSVILGVLLFAAAVYATDGVNTGGPGPERELRVADVDGPNPLAEMSRFTGRSFDWQYMMSMWKQNTGIACIAAIGARRACSGALRGISATIVQEQLALNDGLGWASVKFSNAPKPLPARRFADLIAMLSACPAANFDHQFALTLRALMHQSVLAAQRAIQQVMDNEDEGHLQAQVHATWRVNSAESGQLLAFAR